MPRARSLLLAAALASLALPGCLELPDRPIGSLGGEEPTSEITITGERATPRMPVVALIGVAEETTRVSVELTVTNPVGQVVTGPGTESAPTNATVVVHVGGREYFNETRRLEPGDAHLVSRSFGGDVVDHARRAGTPFQPVEIRVSTTESPVLVHGQLHALSFI